MSDFFLSALQFFGMAMSFQVFVTGAYRQKMEEAQELGRELAKQDRLDGKSGGVLL